MNYGKALQTHSEVIMIFLDDLMYNSADIFPFNLIAINMYLNNVSGTLNMITQNGNGEKNDAKNLLKGYKIIHFVIKEELNIYINSHCKEIQFNYNMVSCNHPPIGKNEYTTSNLVNINNYLKNRILSMLSTSVERNSYENFHPKNILFYHLMTRQILRDKNNSIKIDNSQHIELNLLRFTPLNVKCSDSTRLTIQDVFEYMKYNFNSNDVLSYIKMVIMATFRPIAIVIRNFLTLIQVASSEKSDSVALWLKPNLIVMGKTIRKHVIEFISLYLINNKHIFLKKKVLNGFNIALKNYINNQKLTESDNKNNNTLIKSLSNFFIKNKLYFTCDIFLTNKSITENNADDIKNQFKQIMQNVDIYMNDLKKWSTYFNIIIRNFRIRSFNVSDYNTFFDYKVLNRICNTQAHSEIYNASVNNSHKFKIEYYKDVDAVEDDITKFNLENLKDNPDKSNIDTNDSLQNQSTYKPLYMIDYWPYNV
ncbi:MATH and LRR domain-containing protein PFE0570w-like [Daktulosphaira vitifoliae]|uniref:MATH and LRR domain-containing protein PFE0570w-like n=1 Tax=Daktulosphaira vitifoliae TaxID=58002 RepID=UPI0021AA8212|nr:MATH and LRR domain-containing protein PFE0570w-like [Daktulosphaira vitifoliae]